MLLPKGTMKMGERGAGVNLLVSGRTSRVRAASNVWGGGSFQRIRQTDGQEPEFSETKQKMSQEGNRQVNFPRGPSSLRPGPGLSLHPSFPLLSHPKRV